MKNKYYKSDSVISTVYHEAGHAVVALANNVRVYSVHNYDTESISLSTFVQRMFSPIIKAGGLTRIETSDYSSRMLIGVRILYAGYITEKEILNKLSEGSAHDISTATNILVTYMSSGFATYPVDYNKINSEALHVELLQISKTVESDALKDIKAYKDYIHRLAQALKSREEIKLNISTLSELNEKLLTLGY